MFIHSRRYVLPDRQPVLLNVLYFMPDHQHLLQEFLLQTEDEIPHLPKIHKFLDYWHHHLDAIIKEVLVSHGGGTIANWRHGTVYNA